MRGLIETQRVRHIYTVREFIIFKKTSYFNELFKQWLFDVLKQEVYILGNSNWDYLGLRFFLSQNEQLQNECLNGQFSMYNLQWVWFIWWLWINDLQQIKHMYYHFLTLEDKKLILTSLFLLVLYNVTVLKKNNENNRYNMFLNTFLHVFFGVEMLLNNLSYSINDTTD